MWDQVCTTSFVIVTRGLTKAVSFIVTYLHGLGLFPIAPSPLVYCEWKCLLLLTCCRYHSYYQWFSMYIGKSVLLCALVFSWRSPRGLLLIFLHSSSDDLSVTCDSFCLPMIITLLKIYPRNHPCDINFFLRLLHSCCSAPNMLWPTLSLIVVSIFQNSNTCDLRDRILA